MARMTATERTASLEELLEFVGERRQWVMTTFRTDGRPQLSPVSGSVVDGRLMVATYPFRDKVHNLRRDNRASVCVLSERFGGAWVQVDGDATVIDLPDAMEHLVEYYRSASGEHPDWDEYREMMDRQGKCVISIEIERWGPIATGGFPPSVIAKIGTD